jgi:hypothetical protein
MSVGNNHSKGECCAGIFCENKTMELCVAHKCIICKHTVHILCGKQNLQTDEVECFACIDKAKQNTTATTNITETVTVVAAATTSKKTATSKKKAAIAQEKDAAFLEAVTESGYRTYRMVGSP